MMNCAAFVTAAPSGHHALISRASAICGAAVAARVASRPMHGATTRMVADQGITLQNLTYNPNFTGSTSVGDKDVMCAQIYKQVFGNAYVMESELAELYPAESMYRSGLITVREFVRRIALSATYRRRFFECCGPFRAVELNFKHLLGRGLNSKEEVSEHVQRTVIEGYEADINSIIDSEEYMRSYGDYCVPKMLFKGTYPAISEFTRACSMYGANGTSDKSLVRRAGAIGVGNPNHTLSLDGAGTASKLVSLASETRFPTSHVRIKMALPARPDLDSGKGVKSKLAAPAANSNAATRTRVRITEGNYMYLTAAEAADFNRNTIAETREEAVVRTEMRALKAEIARLQTKLDELSSFV
jgi:phycoerythrin-associated linker protein